MNTVTSSGKQAANQKRGQGPPEISVAETIQFGQGNIIGWLITFHFRLAVISFSPSIGSNKKGV
jgi:hypothetical protein